MTDELDDRLAALQARRTGGTKQAMRHAAPASRILALGLSVGATVAIAGAMTPPLATATLVDASAPTTPTAPSTTQAPVVVQVVVRRHDADPVAPTTTAAAGAPRSGAAPTTAARRTTPTVTSRPSAPSVASAPSPAPTVTAARPAPKVTPTTVATVSKAS